MRIVSIDDTDDGSRWDAYVTPRTATVTDLYAWRHIVREAYGMRSHFFAAMDGERIAGVVGLYEIRHPLFGHYLATAPFGNDGGLHYDDASVRDSLVAEARLLADRLKVSYLVIRSKTDELDGFAIDRHYVSAIADLTGGAEAVWNNKVPSKTRNQVRRGMKEGFTVDTGHGQLGAFHDVFHRHMRVLGSPAHKTKFYESVIAHLGDRADFYVVRDGQALVAGALLFWVNGTAMNYHTVALREYNARCPNYLIYWKMLEDSAGKGCTVFDMGRSEAESSNLKFKQNWGIELVPLRYNYYLRTLKEVPFKDPRNPKYRIPIAIWQKLPLPVTRFLGPLLIPGLV